MAAPGGLSRALPVLGLVLQMRVVLALPYAAINGRTDGTRDLDRDRDHERPHHMAWPSVHGIEYATTTLAIPPTEPPWNPTAYEISDGQVQISKLTTTAGVYGPSGTTTILESSTITDTFTYTPVPPLQTPPLLGTSFTTIFLTPSAPEAASPTPTPAFTTSIPNTVLTSLTTSEVQTATAVPTFNNTGVAHTSLETSGNPSAQPFQSLSLHTSGSLSLVDTSTLSNLGPTAPAQVTGITANNIFQPIATGAPPSPISTEANHPVPRLGIQPQQQRLQTNKFYTNFFLADQTNAVWTQPYSVSWCAGQGPSGSFGMAVSHIERSQVAYGPKTSSDAGNSAYFANPLGVQSLILSAAELSNGTTLTTDTLEAFSVNVNLLPNGGTTPLITFPLVQGMGFLTGCYDGGTPLIESGVGISNVTYVGAVGQGQSFKYRAILADGFTWLIYVSPASSGYNEDSFTLVSGISIQGPSAFDGCIQVAKIPAGSDTAESVYDGSAGVYAKAVNISGAVNGTTGTYLLSWDVRGPQEQSLLMFALPHHMQSLANGISGITDVQLVTTTKGMATGIQADSWTLVEPDLPIDMSFDPWSPTTGSIDTLPLDVKQAINAAATVELAENVSVQTNTGSMYYDGKALAKFAAIVYAAHQLAQNTTLAYTGLQELEAAFGLHVQNLQEDTLVYDDSWGGAVSESTYLDGNSGDDFGNTYYNDHHFHYGYFLYAAAVIGYLDPDWLSEGTNVEWVNMLARDYGNSISDDPYFPFSRMFDWYMGHSWAAGLFASADGKNEESSSEDTMASYGIKMWGKVINDKNMEARGNLMLAVQARSLQNYFLYLETNDVEPPEFVGNEVSGILFDNKIDHTTYFSTNIEYIEGIHMLPLIPSSTLIRTPQFVQQEWDAYDFGTYVNTLDSGWRGILMANLAIIDPETSYNFFSNVTGDFTYAMLDSGASQTWYLAWSAALRGNTFGSRKS